MVQRRGRCSTDASPHARKHSATTTWPGIGIPTSSRQLNYDASAVQHHRNESHCLFQVQSDDVSPINRLRNAFVAYSGEPQAIRRHKVQLASINSANLEAQANIKKIHSIDNEAEEEQHPDQHQATIESVGRSKKGKLQMIIRSMENNLMGQLHHIETKLESIGNNLDSFLGLTDPEHGHCPAHLTDIGSGLSMLGDLKHVNGGTSLVGGQNKDLKPQVVSGRSRSKVRTISQLVPGARVRARSSSPQRVARMAANAGDVHEPRLKRALPHRWLLPLDHRTDEPVLPPLVPGMIENQLDSRAWLEPRQPGTPECKNPQAPSRATPRVIREELLEPSRCWRKASEAGGPPDVPAIYRVSSTSSPNSPSPPVLIRELTAAHAHKRLSMQALWQVMDDADSSLAAWIFSWAIDVLVAANVVFCLLQSVEPPAFSGDLIMVVHLLFDSIFAVEVLARFAVCPDRCSFFRSVCNWIDLMAAVPLVLTMTHSILEECNGRTMLGEVLVVLPFLRLCKILRGFEKCHVLLWAFELALEALPVLFYMLSVIVLFFSAVIYLFEPRSSVGTLPEAVWLTMVTVTAAGRGGGSMPESAAGTAAVSVLIMCSSLYTAITLGIIGSSFGRIWKDRDRLGLIRRMRRCLRQWGWTPKDFLQVFHAYDHGKSGELDLREFDAMITDMGLSISTERMVNLFQTFDLDGSGKVDDEQFVRCLFPRAYPRIHLKTMEALTANKGLGEDLQAVGEETDEEKHEAWRSDANSARRSTRHGSSIPGRGDTPFSTACSGICASSREVQNTPDNQQRASDRDGISPRRRRGLRSGWARVAVGLAATVALTASISRLPAFFPGIVGTARPGALRPVPATGCASRLMRAARGYEAAEGNIAVGDHVQALAREFGQRYPGTVAEVRADSFLIRWDDPDGGPETEEVQPADVDLFFKGYQVGDSVEAIFPDDGTAYPGRVISMNRDGTFQVQWDDPDGGPEDSAIRPGNMKYPPIPNDKLEIGKKYKGTVAAIREYGAFVDIGAQSNGFLPKREISKRVMIDIWEYLQVGQEIDVWFISKSKKGLLVSMIEGGRDGRSFSPDLRPFTKVSADEWLGGTVVHIIRDGAFVLVTLPDGGVKAIGLVHIRNIKKNSYVKRPEEVVKIGQKVQVRVESVDVDQNLMRLSMLQPDAPLPPQRESADLSAFDGITWGTWLNGTVTRKEHWGAFVTVTMEGGKQGEGVIHVTDIKEDGFFQSVDDGVVVGQEVRVRALSPARGVMRFSMSATD